MENAEPEEPQRKKGHLNHAETARNSFFPIINKSGMGKNMCLDLSRDILWDILLRLPFKSLVRFKCVSKTWDSAIIDPWFVKSHHHKQSTKFSNKIVITKGGRLYLADIESLEVKKEFINFPSELQLRGSCNGLICLTDRSGSKIILWNPLTEDPSYIKLVSIQHYRSRYSYQGSVYGFGYDSSNDDYKVVRFSTFFYISRGFTPNAWIYSLRKNAWKEIEIPLNFDFITARNGVFTCGALHWVGKSFSDNREFIFAVDLETNIFREVPLPDSLVGLNTLNIGVLGGCLSVTSLLLRHGVWVMKHYMVKESWTNLFSVVANKIVRPISYSRDAKKVLLQEEGNMPYWYDLENEKFCKLGICGLGWGYCVVENYLETLVSASGYSATEEKLCSDLILAMVEAK